MTKSNPVHSGGIKPLNAPRAIHVRIDSAGNPTLIQVPPAIDSPRSRRKRRNNPHPLPLPTRERDKGQDARTQNTDQSQNLPAERTSPPYQNGRELEGGRLQRRPTHLARALRRNPTPAENLLWKHLRKTQIPKYKFTRQHPIGPYIVDFCCRTARLIIELDGEHHATQQDADLKRQQDLEDHGYRVVRFWNNEIFENIEGVLFKITEELESGNPHPSPLPTRERGHDRTKAQEQATLLSDGKWMQVAEIDDIWKVNDEWWRGPDEEIVRLYYVLRLESGQKLTIYLDLATNTWYRQAG